MSMTAQTCDSIKIAARLRVEGLTWAAVAEKLHYANAESARVTLSCDHSPEWREAYEKAREMYLDEIESEAALTQRSLLRSASEQIRQSASHSLLNHCRQVRAKKVELSGEVKSGGIVRFVFRDVPDDDDGGCAETVASTPA